MVVVVLAAILVVICVVGVARRTSRASNNEARCAYNLGLIGRACRLYANQHAGHYPDKIEGCLYEDITLDKFVCPSSNDCPAAAAPTMQATGANLISGGHLSYIYVGSAFTMPVADNAIVAYEPISNHGGNGSNVLFGDGRVELFQPTMMTKLLAELSAGHNPPLAKKRK